MNPDRPSIASVTQDLATTSDKIRALARAGYVRTEISKHLGIRYQHVRKVLIDAGITEGRQRVVEVERPPVTVTVGPGKRETTADSVLLAAGFQYLGEWRHIAEGEFDLSAKAPIEAGVYAFIVDGVVRYVGLTHTGLRTRLGHYRRGHERQRTSARIKGLIVEALKEGRTVTVLVALPENLTWNGLPVNTAAGLEAGLIRLIRPEWNMLGAAG